MRAILIDPYTCSVKEVEYGGQFTGEGGAYALLGCSMVEAVRLEGADDMLYADEEGWLRDPLPPAFFTPMFPTQPLVGRALVAGPPRPEGEGNECDHDGRSGALRHRMGAGGKIIMIALALRMGQIHLACAMW